MWSWKGKCLKSYRNIQTFLKNVWGENFQQKIAHREKNDYHQEEEVVGNRHIQVNVNLLSSQGVALATALLMEWNALFNLLNSARLFISMCSPHLICAAALYYSHAEAWVLYVPLSDQLYSIYRTVSKLTSSTWNNYLLELAIISKFFKMEQTLLEQSSPI